MSSHLILFRRVLLVGTLLCTFAVAPAQATKDTTPPRTGSISGHVLINNKAAAEVEVGAFGGDSFNRRVATAQAKTDSEGYYHLSGLPATNYQVTTFMPNMIVADSTPQSPLGYGYFVASKTVLLAAGEDVTEIDLKLARGGVITGRVTDADDKPVVEEHISLQPVTEPGQPPQRMPLQSPLYQTDDRGIYRIYGLPPGRYRVSVGQSGSSGIFSVAGFYVLTYHPDATEIARATVIDLAEGAEAPNVDIKVGRRGETHEVTGRVVDAENGLPLSGVRVAAGVVRDQGSSLVLGAISVTTADGSFTIPGIASGRYGVYLATDGGSDFYSDPVVVNVTDQDVGGIEVKALHGTTISGSIVPENTELKELLRQLPGLRVSVNISPADGRITPTSIRSFGSAPVAADGSFTITGLRPGRATLSVDARDAARPSLVKVTVGGIGVTQGFEIEQQPVSGVQMVIAYGTGAIRGSVTMQGGTLTDFRAEVICRREGARTYSGGGAYMDARGHFIIKGLAPGSYDCGVQLIPLPPIQGRPMSRPPQVPHQTITVSNGVETEVTFLVDLTPKGVGP